MGFICLCLSKLNTCFISSLNENLFNYIKWRYHNGPLAFNFYFLHVTSNWQKLKKDPPLVVESMQAYHCLLIVSLLFHPGGLN